MHKAYEEAIRRRGSSSDELVSEGVPQITGNQTAETTLDTADTSECQNENLENARCSQEYGVMGALFDCWGKSKWL